MRRALLLLLTIVTCCAPAEAEVRAGAPPTTALSTSTTTSTTTTTVTTATTTTTPRRPPPALHTASATPAGLGPCGGDLPPCRTKQIESGGDYRIWNGRCYAPPGWAGSRSPCGGSTASGGWQITRPTWAGYGGFLNAADAPPEVQDAKARELWAGGSGCSHWNAC